MSTQRPKFERQPLAHEVPEIVALARKLVAWYLMNGGTDNAFVGCRTWDSNAGRTNAEKRANNETLDMLERLRELIGRDETIVQRRIDEHAAIVERGRKALARRQSSSEGRSNG